MVTKLPKKVRLWGQRYNQLYRVLSPLNGLRHADSPKTRDLCPRLTDDPAP